jgi:MOSC domain-containing protein
MDAQAPLPELRLNQPLRNRTGSADSCSTDATAAPRIGQGVVDSTCSGEKAWIFWIDVAGEGKAMHADPSPSSPGNVQVGSVAALWRYPVKSMMGEELNASNITDRGLLGDRQFAVVDRATGKVGGAKNPRKWGTFFDFRAAYAEPPRAGATMPPVRITLPDGANVTTGQADLEQVLSRAFGREVALEEAQSGEKSQGATAEEYWPDMAGLDYRDAVTDFEMPAGTFFDIAVVHLLTTATIDRLRALYPRGRFEVRRFRPNIVISTPGDEQGFAENDWVGRSVTIGGNVQLAITEPCPRCVMITLPQGDLPKDSGILRTAAQHNGVHVGVYASVIRGGTIRRGDPVSLG